MPGILWGTAGVFVRELYDFGIDRYTVLSTRMLVATAILLIALLFSKDSLLKIKFNDIWIFAGTGLLGILGLNFFYNEAVGQITLSLAAILLSLAPIFVMILSAIIFKERITVKKINCLILAIVGCSLASGIFEASQGSGLQCSMQGVIMGVLSGFFCALYGIFSKIAANKGYRTSTILFYSLLLCTIVLLPFTDWNAFALFIAAAPLKNTIFAISHSACTSILPYMFYSIALLYMGKWKSFHFSRGRGTYSRRSVRRTLFCGDSYGIKFIGTDYYNNFSFFSVHADAKKYPVGKKCENGKGSLLYADIYIE